MAGRGPAPKPAERRARGARSNPSGLRVIHAAPTGQPDLPALWIRGRIVDWPGITREWWSMWAGSPLSAEFTATDWSELRDTARLHALFWLGDKSLAGELRLRVAKFGATPEDRARLRITFAAADEADPPRRAPVKSTSRYKGLRSTGGGLDAVAGA